MRDKLKDLEEAVEGLRAELAGLKKEVRTKRLVLVNDENKERGELLVYTNGMGLILYNETGSRPLLMLVEDEFGAKLLMCDKKSKFQAGLGVEEGGPGLVLRNQAGVAQLELSVSKEGPQLTMFNKAGVPRVEFGVSGDEPFLTMFDKTRRSGKPPKKAPVPPKKKRVTP